MGCFWYCVIGFVLLVIMALVMSVVEWVFYNWWVILLIVAAIALILYLRGSGRWKKTKKNNGQSERPTNTISFEQLIKAAASDGVISAKEKQAIINKGVAAGMEPEEAEIMMEAKMQELGVTYAKRRTSKTE